MPWEGKMPPAAGETARTEAAPELSKESRGQKAAQKQDHTQKWGKRGQKAHWFLIKSRHTVTPEELPSPPEELNPKFNSGFAARKSPLEGILERFCQDFEAVTSSAPPVV